MRVGFRCVEIRKRHIETGLKVPMRLHRMVYAWQREMLVDLNKIIDVRRKYRHPVRDGDGGYHQIVSEPVAFLSALNGPHVPQGGNGCHPGIDCCHRSRHFRKRKGHRDELIDPVCDKKRSLWIVLHLEMGSAQQFCYDRIAECEPMYADTQEPWTQPGRRLHAAHKADDVRIQ